MCVLLAALVTGVHLPRQRSAEARRSTPFPALRGSNRPEFRSERISTTRVIHLRTKLGLGCSGPRERWWRRVCMAGFTGAARSRHSGCGSGRGLPREVARNTTEPLGALLRGYPRRAASAMASGGSPARRRSPYWSKLQATIPSPKQRTREGEAHRGLERVKLQRGIDGVELLRRRTALGTGAGRCCLLYTSPSPRDS